MSSGRSKGKKIEAGHPTGSAGAGSQCTHFFVYTSTSSLKLYSDIGSTGIKKKKLPASGEPEIQEGL
jgi:hypothetical protein